MDTKTGNFDIEVIICPVCLENSVNETTKCAHQFCLECLNLWLENYFQRVLYVGVLSINKPLELGYRN